MATVASPSSDHISRLPPAATTSRVFPQQRPHPASETRNPLSPAPFSRPALSYIPSVLTCNQTTREGGHIICYNRKLHAGDPPQAAGSSSPIAVRITRTPGPPVAALFPWEQPYWRTYHSTALHMRIAIAGKIDHSCLSQLPNLPGCSG
jgi:hypothetical protein